MFVERYYKVLEVMPHVLNRFYGEASTSSINLTHANGMAVCEEAAGVQVRRRITRRPRSRSHVCGTACYGQPHGPTAWHAAHLDVMSHFK